MHSVISPRLLRNLRILQRPSNRHSLPLRSQRTDFLASQTIFFSSQSQRSAKGAVSQEAKLSEPQKDFSPIPGPTSYPFIGSFPDFMRRSANMKELPAAHVSAYEEFGPIYEFNLFGQKQVFTCSPDDYRLIYRSEGRYPPGGAEMLWIVKKWAQDGNHEMLTALSGRGPKWKEVRSLLQKDFLLPKVARSYLPLIEEAMQRSSRDFGAFEDNPDHFCTCAAFDMFSAMFFGLQLETTAGLKQKGANFNLLDYESLQKDSESTLEFIEATKRTFAHMGTTLYRPWLQLPIFFHNNSTVKDYYTKSNRMMEIAAELSGEMMRKYEKESGISPSGGSASESRKGGCPVTGFGAAPEAEHKGREEGTESYDDHTTSINFDLAKELEELEHVEAECMPYLMRLLRKGSHTTEEIQQNVVFLLSAGVDTTRSTLGWLLVALAKNPEVQEKLRQELYTTIGKDEPLNQATITKLPYLNKVMRESHRMYPPSYIMTQRTAPRDVEFDNGKYLVKKGTAVGFNTFAVQNDPKYVERSEEFRPERWDDAEVAKRKGTVSEVIDHKLLSTPFSFGARMCLGGRVAQVEMAVFLARIVREWEFTLKDPSATFKPIQPLLTVPDVFPALKIRRI